MATCSQCGSEVTDGATFCPVCGTPQTAGEAPAAGAAEASGGFGASSAPPGSGFGAPMGGGAPPATGAPAFAFNASNLSQLEWIGAGATLVLFISLFLDWYHVSICAFTACGSASADALAHGYMYVVLLACLAALAVYAMKAGFGKLPIQLPITDAQLILGLGAVNLLFVIIAFFDKGGTSWSFGAFVGLLAALAALAPTAFPLIQKQMANK